MREQLRDFYDLHNKKIWMIVAVLISILLIWVVLSDKNAEEKSLQDTSQKEINRQLEEIQDTFSLLQEYNVGYIKGSLAYEYDLYLKRPFISSADFERVIYSFIELLKYKYNDDKEKQYIVGVKINVFDRKSNFDEGTNPRATVVYQLREEDKKKRSKEEEYAADIDLRWEHTISQEKKPDYTKYTTVTDFAELNISENQPFSEKEYTLFKKLMIYSELVGSYNSGVNAYLVWELGIPQFESKYLILKQFDDFIKIAETYGENMSIYEGQKDKLMERFAKENPRFLAYLLTDEIIDDRLEAKKALVRYDKEFFLDVYIREAQEKVQEIGGEEGVKALEEVEVLKNISTDNQETNNQQYEEMVEEGIGEF